MRGLVKRDPVVPSLSLGFRQSPSGRLRTPQELHLHSSFGWWGRTTLLPEFCSDFLKRLSFGLWNFKKCKQGEGQDDPSEEEEHVRPAEILQGEQTDVVSSCTACGVLRACTVWVLTAMYWKQSAIMKLQNQLLKAARARAVGRGPWLKNSATMNHGIGPGPISKKLTKRNMAVMLT